MSRTVRNGLICAATFLACFWASWPVAEMGFADDWSYIKTTQVFAQTGHIAYFGWASPMLGWQIPWGALFIKLFGFSFMAVKLSTLPVAVATLMLFYAVLVRFGITPRNAILGTLTFGISPLFMPLAASFMTDIPSLLVIVLCLYLCQRAVAAKTPGATIAWLCTAAVLNVAGGTVRQIAWLGTLVMIPATGWLLRKRRNVLVISLLLWSIGAVAIFSCMHWFAKQPYILQIQEDLFLGHPLSNFPADAATVVNMAGEMACLFLVVFPIAAAWLPQIRALSRSAIMGIASLLLGWAFVQWVLQRSIPWVPHILLAEFSLPSDAVLGWNFDRFLLPLPVAILLSLLIGAAALAFVAFNGKMLNDSSEGRKALLRSEHFWLTVPYAACYLCLLVPRASEGLVFDRYVLGLLPVCIPIMILLYQKWVSPELPKASIGLLALFALVSIAGAHDRFAQQRAQLAAAGELRAAGVPRNAIRGGFEYDGWTQIEHGGHINSPEIRVPADAYRPRIPDPQADPRCIYGMWYFAPDIKAQYSIVKMPAGCYLPSQFPPVHYTAWIPPFRRTVHVQKVPARYR